MLSLALAVAVASVLGSLHCVGMCGPLAIWASDSRRPHVSLVAYHLGRLTTYLSAGLVAGLVGSALTMTGQFAGFQSSAAKIAGVVLIGVGVVRVLRCIPVSMRDRVWKRRASHRLTQVSPKPSIIAGLLQHARPIVASQGPAGRGFLAGLLTTWLPCGWLYLFVLAAAGTGDVMAAILVMASFWVGTLPALTGLVLGAGRLARGQPTAVALVAGTLLIATGLYTATGRASADLTSLLPPKWDADHDRILLGEAAEQPLPCCVGRDRELGIKE